MKMGDTITVYSQNVSCDIHSERLIEEVGEDFKFETRIAALIAALPPIDIVAFNEIRYKKYVDRTLEQLEEKGYTAKAFANNNDVMSFNNILAINKSSQWELVRWEHLWLTLNDLQDTHCVMEGDPHGRCAAVVYIKHKKSGGQVCILNSHVVPFNDTKKNQQNALFTINARNEKMSPPIATVLVGDLNRFDDEDEEFQARLQQYNLVESHASKLKVVYQNHEKVITDRRDIGTFTPWPTDKKIYEEKMKLPLSRSRLDVQLYSNRSIKNTQMVARAALLKSNSANRNPVKDADPVRSHLDCKMTSDHIALIGTYRVN